MPTSREPAPSAGVLAHIREALGLGGHVTLSELGAVSLDTLLGFTRRQLVDCARRLGLSGLSRLDKTAVAERFREALGALGVTLPAERPGGTEPAPAIRPQKFELGQPPEPAAPVHIPWSYDQNRVTAIVVDPDRLYVYWEITDDAIARARAGLGAGGPGAWPSLRVYDVTGRLFDGTNAHEYFDRRVERDDRQWFFDVRRPTSTAIVEIGLKSHEGYFVRIARSARADFPRREPAPPGGVEWLTVRSATGDVGAPAANGGGARGGGPGPSFAPVATWDIRETAARADAAVHGHPAVVWREALSTHVDEIVRTLEWEGPIERIEWDAGPYAYPVIPPAFVEERFEGPVTVMATNGRVHVVHGRWEVVIRGIDARGEHEVLARWELVRAQDASVAGETVAIHTTDGVQGSAHLVGASERRWLGASERRLGGASERWRIGASERRLGGASERALAGASERRLGGASERHLGGASERALGGGSGWPGWGR